MAVSSLTSPIPVQDRRVLYSRNNFVSSNSFFVRRPRRFSAPKFLPRIYAGSALALEAVILDISLLCI